MKTVKTKSKEIMKVVAVGALSIGVFSTAFVGFNELIFASATGDAMPLQVSSVAADVDSPQGEQEQAQFTPPTLTFVESTFSQYHVMPEAAMSMEEAAQVGARYIWDVFDVCIDGAEVYMMFANHESQTNTWWLGHLIIPRTSEKSITFVINGVTGERIDINLTSERGETPVEMTDEEAAAMRAQHEHAMQTLLASGWFDMSLSEQIAFAGVEEQIETYEQKAMAFAVRHFNNTIVTDINLSSLLLDRRVAIENNQVTPCGFNFIVVDNTGREAFIFIPAEDAIGRSVFISTQHNDFAPDFHFEDDGQGIG
jgi:hypothetical protein